MEGEQAGTGGRATVTLLTRAGCGMCARAAEQLTALREELGFDLVNTDVDATADAGDPSLRARFGDLLPVILLNGTEHSYWEVDEQQLRADLSTR